VHRQDGDPIAAPHNLMAALARLERASLLASYNTSVVLATQVLWLRWASSP
jgi:hypothetical protein